MMSAMNAPNGCPVPEDKALCQYDKAFRIPDSEFRELFQEHDLQGLAADHFDSVRITPASLLCAMHKHAGAIRRKRRRQRSPDRRQAQFGKPGWLCSHFPKVQEAPYGQPLWFPTNLHHPIGHWPTTRIRGDAFQIPSYEPSLISCCRMAKCTKPCSNAIQSVAGESQHAAIY